MRLPCASSSAAVISATDDLPLVPDDVDRGEAVLRHPQHRDEPPDPLQPEAPAQRLERGEVALGVEGQPRRAPRAPPGSAASFSRSASTTSAGRCRTNPWFAELALGALDLGAQRLAPALRSAGGPGRRPPPPRTGSQPGRSVASASPSAPSNDSRASRATSSWGGSPSLAGDARREHAPGGDPDQVAPAPHAARELDRRLDLPLGGLVDERAIDLRERVDDEHLGPLLAGRRAQVRVDLLGDEGHHRVGKRKRLLEHPEQRRRGLGLAVVEPRLDDLQVPVAELRPEEAVELERRVGEVVGVEVRRDGLDRPLKPGEDPAVLDPPGAAGPSRRLRRACPRAPVAFSRISRDAFHILFARSCPCWIRSAE